MKNIYFHDNWGFFIGDFNDNIIHSHNAVQLSISLNEPILIFDKNEKLYSFDHFLIKGSIPHRLESNGKHLLLLFYPTSSIGHNLHTYSRESISQYTEVESYLLHKIGIDYIEGKLNFEELVINISTIINSLECSCKNNDHYGDKRILKAITFMEENFERVIPIEEICNITCLSESRFLHLFKETIGVTFRKAQQWYKVSKSFEKLFTSTITDTAYDSGFADSAHFTKVCKESFGFSPKILKQLS